MHNIHNILRVILFQKLQNFQFDTSLVHILLLVFNNFQRNLLACFVVNTL